MTEETAAKPPEPILSIDLGENGGPCEFYKLQDIYDWIDAEVSKWFSITDGQHQLEYAKAVAHPGPDLNQIKHKLTTTHAEVLNRSKNTPQKADSSVVEIFKSWLQQNYLSTPAKLLYSSSRLGAYILSVNSVDPRQAFWIWSIWVRSHEIGPVKTGWLSPALAAAVVKGVAFESGFESLASESHAISQIRSQWESINREDRKKFREQYEAAVLAVEGLSKDRDRFAKLFESVETEHGEVVDRHFAEMDAIQTKYRNELAVRSAVTFWGTRASEHAKSARKWGWVASLYAAVAFCFLPLLQYAMSGLPQDVKLLIDNGSIDAAGASTAITQATIVSSIRFIIMALIAMWPLRLFVRNYLSNSHLEADAKEREIIVQTYLALLNDPDLEGKDGLKEQILPHALQNIFRHTADGIVKDDGMPWQSMLDSVAKKAGLT